MINSSAIKSLLYALVIIIISFQLLIINSLLVCLLVVIVLTTTEGGILYQILVDLDLIVVVWPVYGVHLGQFVLDERSARGNLAQCGIYQCLCIAITL